MTDLTAKAILHGIADDLEKYGHFQEPGNVADLGCWAGAEGEVWEGKCCLLINPTSERLALDTEALDTEEPDFDERERRLAPLREAGNRLMALANQRGFGTVTEWSDATDKAELIKVLREQ